MNDNAYDYTTDRPVSVNNEATPDTAAFSRASSTPTYGAGAAAASTIVPDVHWRGMVNYLGLKFGSKNTFLLPLNPGRRGLDDTSQKD